MTEPSAPVIRDRKSAVSISVRATPTTPNSAGIRLCRARFSTAGPSLRAVRSPDAPKITTAAGAFRSSITVCPAAACAAGVSPVVIGTIPSCSGHETAALLLIVVSPAHAHCYPTFAGRILDCGTRPAESLAATAANPAIRQIRTVGNDAGRV